MATTDRSVAFIGVGNMGEAVLAGALRGGQDPSAVHVTARHQERVDHITARYGVHGTTSNRDAAAVADLVVIGVEPDEVAPVLDEIAETIPGTAVAISLAGRVSTTALEEHLPAAAAVVRVAPNTAALIGQGMAALAPGRHCTERQLQTVRDFFALSGEVIVLPEEQLPAVGALSGSGPAHIFYVVDAMTEAGATLGLRRDVARRLAVQTVLGAGALLQETGEHPVVLRERVSSPGGTTLTAVGELDNRGVRAAVIAAMTSHLRG